MSSKIHVFNHPLIHHKISYIRAKETSTKDFRENVSEVAGLMAFEVTRDLETKEVLVKTPVADASCRVLSKQLVIVPILRAGLGMVDGIHRLIPTAKIGHIGIFRDEESLEPKEYYAKFPKGIEDSVILVIDPMLATGGSAIATVDALKSRGAKNIRFVGLVAAPEGVEALQKAHSDVDIYLAVMDEGLNDNGYIIPGLGDAGDRLFGTD